jgi:uncharacterized protein involved in response to NO
MDNNYIIKPIWGLSFRPFFLFGSIISIILMSIWLIFQAGWFNLTGYYDPVTWHAHEMIYGFAASIVIGFLFTASANWTGKKGLHGRKLQILFLTWLSGRFIPIIFQKPNIFAALIDLSFFPLAAYFLIPYLGIKEQRKNQLFFVLFGVLFLGNLFVHLETLVLLENFSRKGIMLGLGVIIMIITVISGRVFPFFTKKAVENARIKTNPKIEKLCLFTTFAFIITNSFFEMTIVNSVIALLAAIFHLIRFTGWYPWQARRIPILWILFFGYFWLITGFILKGSALFTGISVSLSTHAFTAGAIGILIYGMITRVSLGHTGREIKADKFIIAGYIFLNLSVLFRVFLPIIAPEKYMSAIYHSGCLWIAAFLILVLRYWKILIGARIDGKEG